MIHVKTQREDLYKECIPILKSLIQIGDNEEDAIKTIDEHFMEL